MSLKKILALLRRTYVDNSNNVFVDWLEDRIKLMQKGMPVRWIRPNNAVVGFSAPTLQIAYSLLRGLQSDIKKTHDDWLPLFNSFQMDISSESILVHWNVEWFEARLEARQQNPLPKTLWENHAYSVA